MVAQRQHCSAGREGNKEQTPGYELSCGKREVCPTLKSHWHWTGLRDEGAGNWLFPSKSPVLEACSLLVLFSLVSCTNGASSFIWRAASALGLQQPQRGCQLRCTRSSWQDRDGSPHLMDHCIGKCNLKGREAARAKNSVSVSPFSAGQRKGTVVKHL